MKKQSLLSLLVGSVLLCLTPQWLLAAAPAGAEILEQVEPPAKIKQGEPMEDAPEITIRKKGSKTIQEYRLNGELYMMKITPDHGVSYYLYKEDQQSDWVNVGPNPPLAVPKWTLFRF